MADTTKVSNAAVNAEAAAFADLLDNGYLRIYSGSQPANVDSAPGGTLLAELRFSATAESDITDGVITFDTITADEEADASGTAGYFRALSSDGSTAVWDGSVGTSGATLNLNSVEIAEGAEVSVTGLTFTVNKG